MLCHLYPALHTVRVSITGIKCRLGQKRKAYAASLRLSRMCTVELLPIISIPINHQALSDIWSIFQIAIKTSKLPLLWNKVT